MRNSLKLLVCFSGMAIATMSLSVHAETAANTLSRIEEETLILKARERQLDVQAKIIAKQSEISSRQNETDRVAHAPIAGNPLIQSVEGIGTSMHATLLLDNGNAIDTQVGDMLDNGTRIVSIRAHEVIIETSKKKRIRLATAARTQSFNPSFPSAGVSLPPLPSPSSLVGAQK